MRTTLRILLLLALARPALRAQDYAPPNAKMPDKETQEAINERIRRLDQMLIVMQRQGIRDPVLADVEICHKAAAWADRHKEYYTEQSGKWSIEVLDRGMLRANQALRGEAPWLSQVGQSVVRAYRSRVDGSVQPYFVTLPRDYGKDPKAKWRLDVVLHGRDSTISEVKYLRQHGGDKDAPDHPFVLLEIFGRGNNAYRWAGETDVLEAIDAFVATERSLGRDLLDPRRVVLRGFSMGGAGTWHLGLHRPDRWCVIGPGAGFSTTRGYVKDLPASLPPYVESCLHIYDAVDYAANAADVPIVAYAGDQDPQLQAARNIEAMLKPLNIPMTLLVAPGLKHAFPPEWARRAESEYVKYAGPGKGRKEYPERVRFTTYTMKYSGCDWVELLGLERHYGHAEVDATRTENGFAVKTSNVRSLRLSMHEGDAANQVVQIDGQELAAKPALSNSGGFAIYLEKQAGKWTGVLPQKIATDRLRRMQKIGGLQGPIDDAFTDSFICVRGTGTAWNPVAQKYTDASLKAFEVEWDQFLRGKLPVKNDSDITDDDIATRNLILFGDPSSNTLIAQVIDGLPLKWTKESIVFAGKTHDAASHVPVLIYPSPLNPTRYVVLNSGHTFHASDFRGTNALLYPRLGDFAVVKPTPTDDHPLTAEVIVGGLFDEFWKVPAEPAK